MEEEVASFGVLARSRPTNVLEGLVHDNQERRTGVTDEVAVYCLG